MPQRFPSLAYTATSLLHTEEIIIRWGDMDALGHVNNSIYLTYFEQARQSWAEQQPFQEYPELTTVLAQAHISYKKPIVYPQDIRVEVHILEVGHTSAQIGHRIMDTATQQVCFCEGMVSVVWVDRASGRPRAIPAPIRGLFQQRLQQTADGA